MKAYKLIKQGSPEESFEFTETEIPQINDNELLVKVKAVSINPVDLKMRSGMIKNLNLPMVLGYDLSGIVTKVGNNVTKFKIGDEIYSAGANPHGKGGSYAEYTIVNEKLAAIKPHNLTFEEAASIPLVGITAYEALFDKLDLKDNEDILIHGGAGGVGFIALQLAKWRGANVYTTISSSRKKEIVESIGAKSINYTQECFIRYADNNLDGGFTKIFDTVGGKVFQKSLEAVKPYGQVTSILNIFNENLNLTDAMINNASIHFVMMLLPLRKNLYKKMEHQTKILDKLKELIENEEIYPRIEKVFSDVVEAHKYAENSRLEGKLVVKFD